jgi:hypothetical protein
VGRDLERALVGDGEVPHLFDALAEELDADGVLLSGGEHVDDPAAHRELAAPGDEVHALVSELHEAFGDLAGVEGVFRVGLYGRDLAESAGLRLEQAAHWGHDDPKWTDRRVLCARVR